jgi:hypothetical protein
VAGQGFRQGGVEKHHGTAGLEDAKMRGHDLPVVLLHGHSHDLVRACKEGRKGCCYLFSLCIQLSVGQRFSRVRNLQSRVIRELPRRAVKNISQPLNSFLMRNIHQVPVVKKIRQAIGAGILLPMRHLLRRPKVSPPRNKRKYEEGGEDDG